MQAREREAISDELILYGTTGTALVAAVFAAGAGAGSLLVGAVGGVLTAAGVYLSWQVRRRSQLFLPSGAGGGGPAKTGPAVRTALSPGLVAVAAGAALHWLIHWKMETEVSDLYQPMGDIGLLLGLRMAVLTVILSFLLLRREILPFALVPALTVFGLVGGSGNAAVATYCFLIFLPAGLAAVGQAMLLAGLPEVARSPWRPPPRPGEPGLGAGPRWPGEIRSSHPLWRRRHWLTLGALIAAIMALAYLLFLPIVAYATRYRFRLMMPMTSEGFGPGIQSRGQSGAYTSFPVGRGPATLTDTPVLTIQGPPAELWRGEVFDYYTGNAWLRSNVAVWDANAGEPASRAASGIRLSSLLGARTVNLAQLLPGGGEVAAVTHVIRAEMHQPFVFHSAGQLRRVAIIGPGDTIPAAPGGTPGAGDTLPKETLVDRDGCVTAPGALMRKGTTYKVVSTPLEMRPPAASQRPGAPPGTTQQPSELGLPMLAPADTELSGIYTKIPFSVRRVADLARQVVGEAATPWDKLAALISFLQRNYAYSLDAPAVPLGEDAADHFLFRQKRGHCDLFATSLALMARAVGIPTRVAIGYAGGEYDPQQQRWVIREADAHAWVEAYLPPWGWISVDATPAGAAPPIPPVRRALLAIRFFFLDHAIPAVALAGAILAAVLLAVLLTRRGADRTLRAQAKTDPRAAVVWAYVQLCRLLRRRGRPRRPSQTPLEFLASLESAQGASAPAPQARRGRPAPHSPDMLAPVRALTDLFLAARYAASPVSEEIASLAAQHLAEVRRAWRPRVWPSQRI